MRDGKRKRYIGNEESGEEKQRLIAAIAELRLKAKRKTEHMKAEKLKRRLAQLHGVKPFMSGDKWGLQMGNRIIVPPIYKSIKEPVGDYCAVERTAQRWGVIQLDGKVVVDTCYQDIDIKKNGTACLTIFPGKTMKVRLYEKAYNGSTS